MNFIVINACNSSLQFFSQNVESQVLKWKINMRIILFFFVSLWEKDFIQ